MSQQRSTKKAVLAASIFALGAWMIAMVFVAVMLWSSQAGEGSPVHNYDFTTPLLSWATILAVASIAGVLCIAGQKIWDSKS